MSTQREQNRQSDEGYSSDLSPMPKAPEFSRETLKIIASDAVEFRQKYFVEKLKNNSVNGVIYQGYRKSDLFPICVKQIPRNRISHWIESDGRKVPRELYMHLKAQQVPGVVKVLDWYERKSSFVLVMEHPANSMDLYDYTSKYGALTEVSAKKVFRQVAQICDNLHKTAGVLHRDIKDENVLINVTTLEAKIIDFGCATDFEDRDYHHFSGTPEFTAPEIFTTGKYRPESSSVWTLGTFLYVITIGDIPFEKTEQIISGNRKHKKREPKLLSKDLRCLLNSLMNLKPTKRPEISQILKSAWLD